MGIQASIAPIAETQPLKDGAGYSAVILSSPAEIRGLKSGISRLTPQSIVLLTPEFFLGSLTKGWRPRVVAVRNGTELAGVVYAKERIVSGVRLGVTFADLTFGTLLFGEPVQRENAFRVALETLLASPETRGIRLRIRRGGPELVAVRKLIDSTRLDVRVSRVKDHACLSLPGTYEQLLLRFGGATRHNFRRYRSRFEAAGHAYVERLSPAELYAAASYLVPKCSKPARSRSMERPLKMVAAADRPLAMGLKHRNGQWMSVVAGVHQGDVAVLLLQLNNDQDFPRDSLSVVLRAYVIETLIRQGVKELIFWAGTAPPLSHYVTYIPTLGIHLDRPDSKWRFMRRSVSRFGPWLPKHLRADAQWIAPFSA